MPNAPFSTVLGFLPTQALVAQICPGPPLWFLLLIFVGPFVLAGVLLIAALVVFFRHRRAAAVCLFLAVVFFLVGCSVWWCDQSPRLRLHAQWAADVAANPSELRGPDFLGDDDLKLLRNATRLRKLELTYCSLTETGLENLAGLNQLESLSLQGSLGNSPGDHADFALDCLKGLTQLQELNISCNDAVTDVGLKHLQGLTQLRKLNLGCTRITDAGLKYVKGMTELRELKVDCVKITDAGLGRLKELGKLEELDFGDSNITDVGLEQLRAFPNLRTLDLWGTAITDAGLVHLAELKQLTKIGLRSTKATDDGVRRLKQALPKCEITR